MIFNLRQTPSALLLLFLFSIILLLAGVARGQEQQLQIGPILCEDGITTGYTNADDLRTDLVITSGSREFTLCPQTIFDLSLNPLTVSHSVILRCGADAAAAAAAADNPDAADNPVSSGNNNCTLEGGQNQLIIEGSGIASVAFHGLTFQLSTHTSVQLTKKDSIVTFSDCRWHYHVGHSVVFIGQSPPSMPNTTIETSATIVENHNNTAMDDESNNFPIAETILENSTDPNFDDTPEMQSEPIRPIGTEDVTDVVTGDLTVEDTPARIAPTRKRLHHGSGSRQLQSGITTSVTFNQCEFTHNTPTASVVMNRGGFLSISNSTFQFNNATMSPLISSREGELSLTDTTFFDNVEAPTHVFVGSNAVLISNTRNCGNEAFNCNGVFEESSFTSGPNDASCTFTECPGDCTVFDSCMQVTSSAPPTESNAAPSLAPSLASSLPPSLASSLPPSLPAAMSVNPSTPIELSSVRCPTDDTLTGYVVMDSILTDLVRGVVEFQLCPGSVITGSLELQINTVTLVIECMGQDCSWIANKFHVRLGGDAFGFQASGITFRDATETSISFKYESGTAPNYLFEDCVWENNAGPGVFTLNSDSVLGSASKSKSVAHVRSGRHRQKSTGRRVKVGGNDFKRCVFQNNVVEEVIFVENSVITLVNSTFRRNTATGSLLTAFGSSVTLFSSDFEGNFFSASQGLLHLDESSTLDSRLLCALSNIPVSDRDSVCLGISIGGRDCTEVPECEVSCLNSWSRLVGAVETTATLVLCPNTTIDIPDDSPLLFKIEGATLQCGQEGLRSDNCVINGGSDQIVLGTSGIAIIGVTFIGSSRTSVRGEAGLNSTARMRNCEFAMHTGLAVFYNLGGGESFLSEIEGSSIVLSEISDPQEKAMNIEMIDCLFANNTVTLAPVLIGESSLIISNSLFFENEAEVGTVGALFKSQLEVFNSCFLGNSGTSPTSSVASTVFLDDSSDLIRSEHNFGLGNSVKSDTCTGGVTLAGRACVPFTARFCESSIFVGGIDVFKRFSSCVSDFQTLATLVAEPNTTEIEICPLSTFDQDSIGATGSLPLIVDRGNISIVCGRDGSRLNDCRFVGGEKHLEIVGNVTNLVFRGMRFLRATQSAVTIEGSSPLSIDFVDCVWEESSGESALTSTSLDPATESPTSAPTLEENADDIFQDNNITPGRLLDQVGFEVSLTRCSFEDNEVTDNLVVNRGGALNIGSCTFSSNTAGKSIIESESGRLILESSCFDGNDYDNAIGLVFADESMSTEPDSNYVTGGTATADGFNSTFCKASLISADCFDSWQSLSEAVGVARSLGQGSVFTLCQDSVIVADDYSTIELAVPNTVIQCGDSGALENRCTISGGQVQFHVSADRITFRGINMLNSSIAAVHTAGEASGVSYFDSCVLSGHTGLAAIIGYNGDIRTRFSDQRRRTQVDIFPETDATMAVSIKQSFFLKNDVELAPLSVFGGKAVLESTAFTDNSAFSTGVGVWYGGELQLSLSCFDDKGITPSIFVDAGSTIAGVNTTSPGNATTGDACIGILFGNSCLPILDQNCNVSQVVPPPPPQECYVSWVDLGLAIASSLTQGRQGISFVICEGAVMNANENINGEAAPIVVSGIEVEIKCGDAGSRDGNCVITGGRSHFKLVGSGTTKFRGLTFEAATFASILATGESDGSATFTQCSWSQNEGQTVMLINKQLDTDTDIFVDDIVDLATTSGVAMTVLADKCNFENNEVGFGVIANIGGDLELVQTTMVNNRDSRFGVVAGIHGATVRMSYTCFTGNSAIERGIVFIDSNSTLAFNRNAFGSDNAVGEDECSSIFVETKGFCAQLGTCEGNCTSYESRTCRVTSLNVDGTVEPTSSPTLFPSPISPSQEAENVVDSGEKPPESGGSKAGIIAAGIIVPLVLIALGVGYVIYNRLKSKKVDGFEEDVLDNIGEDESQSRSKTQEMDEDDRSDLEDMDINGPLIPLNSQECLPHGKEADDVAYGETPEQCEDEAPAQFEDEGNPIESVVPLKIPLNDGSIKKKGRLGGMLKVISGVSRSSSDGGTSQEEKQKDFVRIKKNKRQLSSDIMSFRDIPTTF